MKKIIFTVVLSLFIFVAGHAEVHTFPEFGGTIDIPDGWDIDSSLADEIVLYRPDDRLVEILFKRYPLDQDYQLTNEAETREAISGLYEEFGVDPIEPSEIPLVIKKDRVVFSVEYVEEDIDFNELMRRYVEGIIVRLKNGGQVLYLLSLKSPLSKFEGIQQEALTMFGSFMITTPVADNLFETDSPLGMLMLFIAVALMIFFFVRNRRIQRSRNPLGRNSEHFWRCRSCGLVNRTDHRTCNRCGAENAAANTP